MKEFSPKTPTEQENFGFEFVLDDDEVITPGSAVWEIRVYKGTDANPSAMLGASPTISGNKVSCLIIGGLNGVIYTMSCRVVTNKNPRLEEYALLHVKEGWKD